MFGGGGSKQNRKR